MENAVTPFEFLAGFFYTKVGIQLQFSCCHMLALFKMPLLSRSDCVAHGLQEKATSRFPRLDKQNSYKVTYA